MPGVRACGVRFEKLRFGSSIKKLAHSNAECGLRLRLRPIGASAPEGEPSGSERLPNVESKANNSSTHGAERKA